MIEKNKENQTQSLGELQQELKSLKALLLSRGPNSASTPLTPLPSPGRPAIPSWQLASTNANNGTESSTSLSPAPPITGINSLGSGINGKGKEVVQDEGNSSYTI